MTDPELPTRTEGEGATLDMPKGTGAFTKGQILGERYQIIEMLGRRGIQKLSRYDSTRAAKDSKSPSRSCMSACKSSRSTSR
jgi:hypothetical protein